jgi:hypothetical protein
MMTLSRAEQLVENIAEPCLEHIDLGLRDQHLFGPVVDDTPSLKGAFDWSADARPGLDFDVKIVGEDAEAGSSATIFAAMGTWIGHPDRIARTADKQNIRILLHNPIREDSLPSLAGKRAARPWPGARPLGASGAVGWAEAASGQAGWR